MTREQANRYQSWVAFFVMAFGVFYAFTVRDVYQAFGLIFTVLFFFYFLTWFIDQQVTEADDEQPPAA